MSKTSKEKVARAVIKNVSGNTIAVSAVGNNRLFTGRELDYETGLYYYRARYYSPKMGRFLQTDPIGYADSMNMYSYCMNNPVNFVDPHGLFVAPWHFAISYMAARESGYGTGKSLAMARDSSLWDFAGTQGVDDFSSNMHAMRGVEMTGMRQTIPNAIQGHKYFIDTALQSGYRGAALHAAEDQFARGHGFREWEGFGLNLDTIEHIWDDMFPSTEDLGKAMAADMMLLDQQEKNNGCEK